MTSKHTIQFAISAWSLTICLFNANALATLTCFNPQTECVEAGETRHIDGAPITLDCWRYKTTYECKEESDNNCESLRAKGCSQVSAKCKTMVAGSCVVQDETYQCPVEQCDEAGKIVCGKKPFCVDDGCVVTTPTKNQNFDKAASALAALASAAEEVKDQNVLDPQLFKGTPMECSINIASGLTKDCCGKKSIGFLEGSVIQCDEEEKALAQKKEAGVAIEIGKYCYNEVLGVCTSHHKVYCVFDNKIARIIQNDGRKNQLGIGFGDIGDDYAHPDCRAITKEELAQMDFSKMDFSAIYNDIRNNVSEKLTNSVKPDEKFTNYTLEDLQKKNLERKGGMMPEAPVTPKAAGRLQEFYDRAKK